ncbi:MAG: hypothetical protein JO307_15340 [Bryobacterales bacterium]|nr:hypothetical protein [Bryobacterales bacterium]MBV9396350.1 hypothetical protein [Bryobacterales bacterium]
MQIPAVFGKYELLEKLSAGPVDLYRGRKAPNGPDITIQILNSKSTDAKSRFLQAARVMARTRHENISTVAEVGELDGYAYTVLEELPGEDIAGARKQNHFPSVRDALKAAAKVAGAFSFLEGHGVRIGEIVPQSVQIDFDGRVKAINAGFGPGEGAMGTFGALLYELMEAPGDAPAAAAELAQQCMDENPDIRPKNFGEVFGKLQHMVAPRLTRQPRNPGKSLVRLSVVVYGLVLLFTALAIIAWYFYQPPAAR